MVRKGFWAFMNPDASYGEYTDAIKSEQEFVLIIMALSEYDMVPVNY